MDQRVRRSSPLSPERLANFQALLERRREALRAAIQAAVDPGQKNLSESVTSVRDPGDDSIALQLSDMNISTTEKSMAELRAVEAALGRIEDGSYGWCMDCGGEIPIERLDAYPTAERCTACQARRENLRRDITPSL